MKKFFKKVVAKIKNLIKKIKFNLKKLIIAAKLKLKAAKVEVKVKWFAFKVKVKAAVAKLKIKRRFRKFFKKNEAEIMVEAKPILLLPPQEEPKCEECDCKEDSEKEEE